MHLFDLSYFANLSVQPVPFPLIQMSRTLMFTYVFTVPFVMLSDKSSDFAHCFIVFLLTYGFMGLEMIAIELDSKCFQLAIFYVRRNLQSDSLFVVLF